MPNSILEVNFSKGGLHLCAEWFKIIYCRFVEVKCFFSLAREYIIEKRPCVITILIIEVATYVLLLPQTLHVECVESKLS